MFSDDDFAALGDAEGCIDHDDEAPLCGCCAGSGEGMWDGSICRACHGSGHDYEASDEDYDRDDYDEERAIRDAERLVGW